MQLSFILILFLFFSSNSNPSTKSNIIVNRADIEASISDLCFDEKYAIDEEIDFWKKKLTMQQNGFIYHEKLAELYGLLFDLTGNINNIKNANRHLSMVTHLTTGKRQAAANLRLSSNSIKLHQFKEAYSYTQKAFQASNHPMGMDYMVFDAAMEIGRYDEAKNIIENNHNDASFDYMVRYAKYQDHIGDIDRAVEAMEGACQLAINTNKKQYLWALSNLGDMYGHQGRIDKSYSTYLEALDINPNHLHVLKGIAWIAYSHDNNVTLATEIMNKISEVKELPVARLAIAEMMQTQNNDNLYQKHIEAFKYIVSEQKSEDMHATYLIEQSLQRNEQIDYALQLAQQEVDKRPTPEIYALLALCLSKKGEKTEAIRLISDHVIGHTYDPMTLYRSAMALDNADAPFGSDYLYNECLDASFELGPVITADIKQRLKHR